eukprot:ctg_1223.g390
MLEAAASRLAQTGASCGAFSVADTAAEACRALGNLCATPDGRAAAVRHKPVLRALCQTVLAYVRRNSAAGSPLPPPFPDACRALANLCIDQGAARVAMQAGADVALLAMLDDADGQGDGHHEGRRALMVLAHGSDEARAELLMHLKQRVELAVKKGRSTAALIELRGTLVQLARQRSGGAVAAAAAAVAHAPSSLKSRGRQVARRFQSTGHTVNTRTLGDHGDRFFTSDTFELGQVLGRGGYGVVYLARNTRTNEVVAIKSFQVMDSPSARGSGSGSNSERPDQRSGQPTIDPRAFKEQRLWKRLRHENIVEYKGSFVGERGDLNLVLEYVDGWSLAEHLAQFNEFDEPLVREITRQVLRGLAYLHRHGITHRDLKPGNLLCRLADARQRPHHGRHAVVHRPGDDRGTPLRPERGHLEPGLHGARAGHRQAAVSRTERHGRPVPHGARPHAAHPTRSVRRVRVVPAGVLGVAAATAPVGSGIATTPVCEREREKVESRAARGREREVLKRRWRGASLSLSSLGIHGNGRLPRMRGPDDASLHASVWRWAIFGGAQVPRVAFVTDDPVVREEGET